MDFIYEKWDAIDLFCEIVAKHGSATLEELHDESTLHTWLGKFLNRDFAASVTDEIIDKYNQRKTSKTVLINNKPLDKKSAIKKKAEEQAVRTPKWSRLLNEMASAILNGAPVILSNEQVLACLFYIDNKKPKPTDRQQLVPFKATTKRQKLHNTKWCLYFVEDHNDSKNKTGSDTQSLWRANLNLMPLGKAELIRKLESEEKERHYKGYYELYENNYLLVHLRIEDFERDLRIIFYLDSLKDMELALGIVTNVLHGKFFAKKVLIQPIRDVQKQEEMPDFFDFQNKSATIPDVLWSYFAELSNNIIMLPTGVITFAQLKELLVKRGLYPS